MPELDFALGEGGPGKEKTFKVENIQEEVKLKM